jgi:hypothetical protein
MAIVPVTAWLLTGIEVAPETAPADVAVNTWPEVVTLELPGTATLRAATGIDVMLPLRAAPLVVVRAGSSGGLSSLLVRPPLMVNPP